MGVTAAVQIQDEWNPYNHTVQDTYTVINLDYFYEQIKATTAFAAHLTVPIPQKPKYDPHLIPVGY